MPSVIPRADDEKMARGCFQGGMSNVVTIKGERTELVAVILSGDTEDGKLQLGILFRRWDHGVVIGIDRGVTDHALKDRRRVANELVDVAERKMLAVSVEEFLAPELGVAEKISLAATPAGKGQPLDIVAIADVVRKRKIQAGMCRGHRDNSGKMRRQLLGRRPLIKPGIRSAPHRDLTVAEGLCRQPFDDVVSVAGLICERLEVARGVAATAHINEREPVAARRKVGRAGMVAVGYIGGRVKITGVPSPFVAVFGR